MAYVVIQMINGGVVALPWKAIKKFRVLNKLIDKTVTDISTEPTKIIQTKGNF